MIEAFAAAISVCRAEIELVRHARENMTPEQFEKWQAERTAERRHRELCRSIEKAGENARPRGLGLFW
jgi:hypothetical protein